MSSAACELGGHVPPSHGTGQSCVYGRPSALILWTALVLLSRIDRVDGTSAVTTCSPSPCKASCGPSRFHFAAYSCISADPPAFQLQISQIRCEGGAVQTEKLI